MVPMYLLMSAFHLAPWLKLMSGHNGVFRAAGSGHVPDDEYERR
jgi:hypothetical protein